MQFKVRLSALLAAPLLFGAPAMAQTVAVPPADAPVASAPQSALDAQIAAYLNASSQAAPVKAGPAAAPLDEAAPDRAVHGSISVGAGSRGYREVEGSLVAPLGNGTVAVAFGQERGRGYFGPIGDGDLSVAGALDRGVPADALASPARAAAAADPAATAAPSDCASSTDKSGKEPLWMARLRAAHPSSRVGCSTGPVSR